MAVSGYSQDLPTLQIPREADYEYEKWRHEPRRYEPESWAYDGEDCPF
jgi:hypothetical protein